MAVRRKFGMLRFALIAGLSAGSWLLVLAAVLGARALIG